MTVRLNWGMLVDSQLHPRYAAKQHVAGAIMCMKQVRSLFGPFPFIAMFSHVPRHLLCSQTLMVGGAIDDIFLSAWCRPPPWADFVSIWWRESRTK